MNQRVTQCITTRELIDANKRALAESTLGAFNFTMTCLYRYPNGHHCAIGACLSREVIQRLDDENRLGHSVGMIMNAGIVEFDEEEDAEIARLTQRLHDAWVFRSTDLPVEHIYDFHGRREAFEIVHANLDDGRVVEKTFRAWIDWLDQKFPA